MTLKPNHEVHGVVSPITASEEIKKEVDGQLEKQITGQTADTVRDVKICLSEATSRQWSPDLEKVRGGVVAYVRKKLTARGLLSSIPIVVRYLTADELLSFMMSDDAGGEAAQPAEKAVTADTDAALQAIDGTKPQNALPQSDASKPFLGNTQGAAENLLKKYRQRPRS